MFLIPDDLLVAHWVFRPTRPPRANPKLGTLYIYIFIPLPFRSPRHASGTEKQHHHFSSVVDLEAET